MVSYKDKASKLSPTCFQSPPFISFAYSPQAFLSCPFVTWFVEDNKGQQNQIDTSFHIFTTLSKYQRGKSCTTA